LEERRLERPMSLTAAMRLPTQDLADRQVVFTATFDNDNYVLLDNRLRDGRFGYEVVAFVSVGDPSAGTLIAPLNLGWIEGDRSRMTTPSPQLPTGERRVHGRIYQSAGEAFLLGENAFPSDRPAVVQQLTLARWEESMRETLGSPVFPFEVRVLPTEPTAFSAEWAVVNQTPAKHRGYAVQWFTMAAALGLAFIFRSSNLATWLRHRLVSSGD
jgi:surfeit locus 1 family protein